MLCHAAVTAVRLVDTLATGSSTAQVTLLREYCQGPNEMMYVLPTGGYDGRKHSNLQACAAAELSEEARSMLLPLTASFPASWAC